MEFGIRRGALRPIPLKVEEPAPDADAEAKANAAYLKRLRVCVRNGGRQKALEVQRQGAALSDAGDTFGAAAYVVRELVGGMMVDNGTLVPHVVVGDLNVVSDAVLSLGPGVDPDVLVAELDGQHLLELVAMTALGAQTPSAAQLGF
jgi:hypothetical protein